MDMSTSTMAMMASSTAMAGMDMTATASGSMASSTSMSDMNMDGMMDMGTCMVSMLWNWNTIDSCFISQQWHITSNGMFAGSCIGVVLLVMLLEFLRRSSKEYDRYILRQFTRAQSYSFAAPSAPACPSKSANPSSSREGSTKGLTTVVTPKFRPNTIQQAIRALLHMFQFTVAYFIMALFMYYNGYIIFSIIIGAFLGSFVFSWESIDVKDTNNPQEEATVCCG